jgi:hypothetical protein
MPDVLKAPELDARDNERQRTSLRPRQHGQALPEVDPAATPPSLRPHAVWMQQLLRSFAQQRRVSSPHAPFLCVYLTLPQQPRTDHCNTLLLAAQNLRSLPAAAPTSGKKSRGGGGLPPPGDAAGWDNILWPGRSHASSPLQPTLENLQQCAHRPPPNLFRSAFCPLFRHTTGAIDTLSAVRCGAQAAAAACGDGARSDDQLHIDSNSLGRWTAAAATTRWRRAPVRQRRLK